MDATLAGSPAKPFAGLAECFAPFVRWDADSSAA
jgi:hypothetical protein